MTSSAPAVRARRRTAFAVVLCAGLTVALTACAGDDPDEGTNGVGKLTAAQIEKKTRAAADGADAVRLTGKLVSKGGTYALDMQLSSKGGTGSVTSKKNTFALLRVGDELFLKADAGFWKAEKADDKSDQAADKLGGKYVKVPEDDPTYKQLRGFTEKKTLLDGMLTLHGKVDKGDRDTIGGVRTVQILGGKGEGGALDVSLKGTPYPLRVARGGGGGTVTLADWGKSFPLEAPAENATVDYGGQLPRSSG
uniref:Lipoprotein n=1 Tax=Streptomyces sp. NBC_01401 TaxID=2903854 RepID=A0AAU3GSQ8_9ACTN